MPILSDVLILPGSLEFELAKRDLPPPPGWRQFAAKTNGEMALIGRAGQCGMLEAVSLQRFAEYCNDGELDERQEELEAEEEEISVLWL